MLGVGSCTILGCKRVTSCHKLVTKSFHGHERRGSFPRFGDSGLFQHLRSGEIPNSHVVETFGTEPGDGFEESISLFGEFLPELNFIALQFELFSGC